MREISVIYSMNHFEINAFLSWKNGGKFKSVMQAGNFSSKSHGVFSNYLLVVSVYKVALGLGEAEMLLPIQIFPSKIVGVSTSISLWPQRHSFLQKVWPASFCSLQGQEIEES